MWKLLGPTQRVGNIEASIFQMLPVIFLVGMEMSIRHAMAGSGLLLRLLMPSQRLNAVACNIESSDLSILAV